METQTNTHSDIHTWSQIRERALLASPLIGGIFAGTVAHIVVYNDVLNEAAAIDHKIDNVNASQAAAEQDAVNLKDARQTLRHDGIAVPTEIAQRIAQDRTTVQHSRAEVKQLTAEKPDVPDISAFMIGGIILAGVATWGVRKGRRAWQNRSTSGPDEAE